MTDKISRKIINIFEKHKNQIPLEEDEKIAYCEDGICYVCVKKDENGHPYDEKLLTERADKNQYIVRIMVSKGSNPYLYNYKVPGNKITEFLAGYITGEKEGRIIEIESYMPSDPA